MQEGKSNVTGGGVYLKRLLPILGGDTVGEGFGDGARPRLGFRAGVQPLLDVLEGSPQRPRTGADCCARELAGLPMPLPLRRGGVGAAAVRPGKFTGLRMPLPLSGEPSAATPIGSSGPRELSRLPVPLPLRELGPGRRLRVAALLLRRGGAAPLLRRGNAAAVPPRGRRRPRATLEKKTRRRRSGVGEESGTRAGGGGVGRRTHEEEWRGFTREKGRRARGEEWWLSRPRAGEGNARGLAAARRAPWRGLRGWGIRARLGPPPQCRPLCVVLAEDGEEGIRFRGAVPVMAFGTTSQ